MKQKAIIYVILGLLLLSLMGGGAFGFTMWQRNKQLQAQVRDLQVSLAHAAIPMVHDTIHDSVPVVTQRVVTVDRTDYKKQLADKQLIRDLGLKLSQIEAENNQLRETVGKVRMQSVRRDSDSLYVYHDKWVDFELNLLSRIMAYQTRDSFDTFIARQYKHKILWGLIKWGTKGYEVKFVNYNPNSRVIHNKCLNFRK